MHEVLKNIINNKLSPPLAKYKYDQNTLPYKAQIKINKCNHYNNNHQQQRIQTTKQLLQKFYLK